MSHLLWDYKLNPNILPSQVKSLKIYNEMEGKILCSFESQCIVAYIISYIDNVINRKERKKWRKDGKKKGKNTGYKGTKNNKIILTVFIMDACFCKHSRNWIAFRVTGCGQVLFCCLSVFSWMLLEWGEYQYHVLISKFDIQIWYLDRNGFYSGIRRYFLSTAFPANLDKWQFDKN